MYVTLLLYLFNSIEKNAWFVVKVKFGCKVENLNFNRRFSTVFAKKIPFMMKNY